jgi:hypothetical protein
MAASKAASKVVLKAATTAALKAVYWDKLKDETKVESKELEMVHKSACSSVEMTGVLMVLLMVEKTDAHLVHH